MVIDFNFLRQNGVGVKELNQGEAKKQKHDIVSSHSCDRCVQGETPAEAKRVTMSLFESVPAKAASFRDFV